MPAKASRPVFLTLLALVLFPVCGCTDLAGRTLGAIPITTRPNPATWDCDADLLIDPVPAASAPAGPTSGKVALLKIYRVDLHGRPTDRPSTDDGVFRVSDVSEIDRRYYLGVDTASPHAEDLLTERRRIIAMKLLEIADMNGQEYWRRFSALTTYERGFRAGGKALMGAGVAATFISPVLGAALTGGGLALETTTDYITAGFDPEQYTALREAVRGAVLDRRHEVLLKLEKPYDEYPVTAVIADITDYSYIYTIRGAVDALKKATKDQTQQAQDRMAKLPEEINKVREENKTKPVPPRRTPRPG